MEAEVSDLPAFSPDTSVLDINGAGRQNVYDVLKRLYVDSLLRLMEQNALEKTTDPILQKALVKAYEDESKLTERLLKNISIDFP